MATPGERRISRVVRGACLVVVVVLVLRVWEGRLARWRAVGDRDGALL